MTQQRVGVREAPGVAAEEDLVEAEEEAVEAEQDHRHGKRCDAERERGAEQQPPRDDGAPAGRATERDREGEDDDDGGDLRLVRHTQPAADVPHVPELAGVERARPVRQRGPLEQRDPFAAGQDRVQARQREARRSLVVRP